jgi:hypothetical protein
MEAGEGDGMGEIESSFLFALFFSLLLKPSSTNFMSSNTCRLIERNFITVRHPLIPPGSVILQEFRYRAYTNNNNSVALVREPTILIDRPLLVGEVNANFYG